MTARFRPAEAVQSLEVDADVLLYRPDEIHRLTGSGVAIWRLLDRAPTREELVRALTEQHPDTASDALATEVHAFLDDLVGRELVATGPDEPPAARVSVPDHVAWTAPDGATVVVADLRTGERRSLSPTASSVWLAVVTGEPMDRVVARMREDYTDLPEDVEAQVGSLVAHLLDEGLLA